MAGSEPAARLTWEQVLAWRMRRQLIDPPGADGVIDTVRTVCGIQAQVASAAELAVALRRTVREPQAVDDALRSGTLMRTWAMRGTLHVLAPVDAGSYLALMAALRSWERPAWQRTFGASPAEIDQLVEVVADVLDGRVLERDELSEQIAQRTGSRDLDEHLRSGWGATLKPLAWMGELCNGPSRAGRVTFTRPASWLTGWSGLPETSEAARAAISTYLRAYGPATPEVFDSWLTRGTTRKSDVRAWFAALEDELVTVDVEGEVAQLLAEDLDELCDTAPSDSIRLLGSFDQYLLGPGTGDPRIVAPHRRKQVSKTAGWISPVLIRGGRVAGIWELDGERLALTVFEESGPVSSDALEAEVERLGTALGMTLAVELGSSEKG